MRQLSHFQLTATMSALLCIYCLQHAGRESSSGQRVRVAVAGGSSARRLAMQGDPNSQRRRSVAVRP